MFTRVALLLFVALFSQVNTQYSVSTNANWNPSTGTYRNLQLVTSPDGFIITGVKVQLQGSATGGSVSLDAARFAVGNGGNNGQNVPGFYLGVLSASAQVQQLQANTSIWAGSVAAAYAEVLAGFYTIMVYYNLDNTPGFQYNLGYDAWTNCEVPSANLTNDCTYDPDNIKLANVSWSAVTANAIPCQSGAPANCTAYRFETTGSKGGSTVITLGFTVATHPVTITGPSGYSINVDPDHGEIDVTITYPWASRVNTRPNPCIALMALAAGRAGAAGAVFVAASSSVSFTSAAGKSTSFGWVPTAKVGSTNSQVHVTTFTDTSITSYVCLATNGCTFGGALLVAYLKFVVAFINGASWACQIIIFSWADVQPTSVFWDPVVGQDPSNTPTTSSATTSSATTGTQTSPAATIYAPLIILVVALVRHLFWN